jgi:hypothetical protein
VKHKVCNNIFLIVRLGGELVVKINVFIISILSLIDLLSISNTLEMEGVSLFTKKSLKLYLH